MTQENEIVNETTTEIPLQEIADNAMIADVEEIPETKSAKKRKPKSDAAKSEKPKRERKPKSSGKDDAQIANESAIVKLWRELETKPNAQRQKTIRRGLRAHGHRGGLKTIPVFLSEY